MLLIKQGILSALRNKAQIIVFILLITLSSLLTTSLFISADRLRNSNSYMGYGTFHYDYSYNYISTSYDQNNIQTISPFYSFSANYASYGTGLDERNFAKVTIGDNTSALMALNLTANNIDFSSNPGQGQLKSNNLIFNINNVNVEQGIFGDFFHFNLTTNNNDFSYSLIGKIYQNIINNSQASDTRKTKAKNLLTTYMQMVYSSEIFANFKQLLVNYINQNTAIAWTPADIATAINDFVNPSSSPRWQTQNVTLNDLSNIPTAANLYAGGLRGDIGLIINKATGSTPTYNDLQYVYGELAGNSSDFTQNLLATGAFRIRNLSDYSFFTDFSLQAYNSDFVQTYYGLLGVLSNFSITTRDQVVAWDINRNTKYKFINWVQPYESNQLKITKASKYWDQIKNMTTTAIISPQYAKSNNLPFDTTLKVGNGAELNIEAYGGDTQNIYPTIYDTDYLPNTRQEAIIYISPTMFNRLFNNSDSQNQYYDTDAYQDLSIVQLSYQGNDKVGDIQLYQTYLADNFNHLTSLTAYLHDPATGTINNNSVITAYEDNSLVNMRYTLLNQVTNIWTYFTIACIIFFLCLVIYVTVVLVKKILDKQRSQIGIMKANGYSSWKISRSYWAYIFVTLIIGIPIGWILGVVFQIPIISVFSNYFILSAKFSFNAWPLLYLFLIFGVVISAVVLITCYSALQKPVMSLVYPNQMLKPNKALDVITSKIYFKRFLPQLSFRLLSTSVKDIVVFFITFLIVTAILTITLLTPLSITKLKNQYYENIKLNNEANFTNIAGNSPLSRYSYYLTEGYQENYNPAKPAYPITNNDLMANWVYLQNEPNPITLEDYALGVKSGKYNDIEFLQYITNMMVQNLGQLKGANISLGMFQNIIELANTAGVLSKISTMLQSITCNILPVAFGQLPITILPYPVLQLMKNISYCVAQATNGIIPSQIKEAWFASGKSVIDSNGNNIGVSANQLQFVFGFGTLPYDEKTDDFYTGFNGQLLTVNGNSLAMQNNINSYGISSDKMFSFTKNDFNNLLTYDQTSSNIPIIINQATAKQDNLHIGDQVTLNYNKTVMQYNSGTPDQPIWTNIDPSAWVYNDGTTTKNLDTMDLNYFTYSEMNSATQSKWGYADSTGTVTPYYQMRGIELQLPSGTALNAVQTSAWDGVEININRETGAAKTRLFQTADGGGYVNNNVVTNSNNILTIKTYDNAIDHSIANLTDLSSSGFPTTWIHEAIKAGLLRTTTITEITKPLNVINIQNTYDAPRLFMNQKYANDLLGYANTVDENNNLRWFNGRLSTNSDPADQTKRYVLASKTGDYSLLNFNNLKSAVGTTDYIYAKKAIIDRLADISLSLIATTIAIVLLITIIIVFLMTDWIVNRYAKTIAFLRVTGYRIREINSVFLGIFIPFIFLAWIIGFFVTSIIVKYLVLDIMETIGITLPFGLSWITLVISILLISVIFASTFIISSNKIRQMNIQMLVTLEE